MSTNVLYLFGNKLVYMLLSCELVIINHIRGHCYCLMCSGFCNSLLAPHVFSLGYLGNLSCILVWMVICSHLNCSELQVGFSKRQNQVNLSDTLLVIQLNRGFMLYFVWMRQMLSQISSGWIFVITKLLVLVYSSFCIEDPWFC